MGEATLTDCVSDAHKAYQVGKQLGEQVILIGMSMEGAISTWLTTQPEIDAPLGLVLISPC